MHQSSAVTLSGDLDIFALPAVERAFATLEGRHVRIDLHEARSVSAAFFGALIRLRKRLPETAIEVAGADRNVRRTFGAVGAEALVQLT